MNRPLPLRTLCNDGLDVALRGDAPRGRRAGKQLLRALDDYVEAGIANLAALEQHASMGGDALVRLSEATLTSEERRLADLALQVAGLRASLRPRRRGGPLGARFRPSLARVGVPFEGDALASARGRRGRMGAPFGAAAVTMIVAAVIGFAAFSGRVSASADTRIEVPVVAPVASERPAPPAVDPTPAPARSIVPRSSMLDRARVVALYGHPGQPVMGALGKYTPVEAAQVVMRLAREQQATDSRLTVGALHVVVGVAQAHPTADGTYLERLTLQQIEPYVAVARQYGLLLILDTQIGWADPLAEVRGLEPVLAEPFVHLALDPEFATGRQRVAPGTNIGSMDAAAVNAVADYLAALVRRSDIPKKLLIVHQFRGDMLTGMDQFRTSPEVDLVIDMDGFGPPASKIDGYDQYALAPYAVHPAIKLFFEWDEPLITPRDMAEWAQPPAMVIYQ